MTDKGTLSHINIIILIGVLSALAIWALVSLYQGYEDNRQKAKQEYLSQNHQKAIIEFKEGIAKYSLLVSSLRAYIIENGEIPEPADVQQFITNQLKFADYGHSLIINYFDTTHTFVFSITESDLNPIDLAGVKLSDIRDSETVQRMNYLLSTDELVSFPPINLYEGFVGYPIDFSVRFNNKVVGYVAPLIDIKNILNPIILKDIRNEFTYRFSYGEDIEFDRERVYNNTIVHHSRIDTNNSHLDKSQYLNENIDLYNLNFNIGIAYKNNEKDLSFMPFVRASYSIIISLIILSLLLIYFFLQILSGNNKIKKNNQELSFMNSILKKFIYASSHDLKQPLINIGNFQSLLSKKYGRVLDATGHKYLNVIETNLKTMEAMLDDLLIYSRVISDKKTKQKINLNKLLESIKSSLSLDNVEFHFNQLPTIFGIESEIQRLFRNLISNSIKFNNCEVPVIYISAEENKGSVSIIVSDNGIGIEEQHLAIIFDEFQRVDKKNYPGTGLGLSICKEIVTNHGGSIKAQKNDLGGTDIIIQIENHD